MTLQTSVLQTSALQNSVLELAKGKPAPVNTSLLAQPGTLGFLVVFGMAVILFFVFRSMSRHLRKVNDAARAEEESARANDSAVIG